MSKGTVLNIMAARPWTEGGGTQQPYEHTDVSEYDQLVVHVHALGGRDLSGCSLDPLARTPSRGKPWSLSASNTGSRRRKTPSITEAERPTGGSYERISLQFKTGLDRRDDRMKEIKSLPIWNDNTIYTFVLLGRDGEQDAGTHLGKWFGVAWEGGAGNEVVAEVTALARKKGLFVEFRTLRFQEITRKASSAMGFRGVGRSYQTSPQEDATSGRLGVKAKRPKGRRFASLDPASRRWRMALMRGWQAAPQGGTV